MERSDLELVRSCACYVGRDYDQACQHERDAEGEKAIGDVLNLHD